MSKISWWSQEIEALGDYYIISKSEYKFVEKLMAVAITHRAELGFFSVGFEKVIYSLKLLEYILIWVW